MECLEVVLYLLFKGRLFEKNDVFWGRWDSMVTSFPVESLIHATGGIIDGEGGGPEIPTSPQGAGV